MAKGFEGEVVETIKWCQERKEPPLVWMNEVAKCVARAGLDLPSVELGEVLVSLLCFSNNHPSLWKLMDYALYVRFLSPLHIFCLLTSRVIPHRYTQPEAYRLYLELLSQHTISSDLSVAEACEERIVESVDVALQLSQTYGIHIFGVGHALVLSFSCIIISLIDSILEDWGLHIESGVRENEVLGDLQNMDVDSKRKQINLRNEHLDQIRRTNSFMALEVLGKLSESRQAKVLLRLVHLNIAEKFEEILQKLHFLEAHKQASPETNFAHHLVVRLSVNIQRALHLEYHLRNHEFSGMLIDGGSCKSSFCCNTEGGPSGCWVSFDIYMENVMDGKQLPVTSAIYILKETINTLQVYNRASWQETFLELWLSALRLVQRERDPLEGPVPHLEARLSVLLSIVPLAITCVLEDEAKTCTSFPGGKTSASVETGCGPGIVNHMSRKQGLISSLQLLGHFTGLLHPPAAVVGAANSAAVRSAHFIANSKKTKDGLHQRSCSGTYVQAVNSLQFAEGNMRHLIVEACIARNLMDTSAYLWPGYVSPSLVTSVLDTLSVQSSPWTTFMDGASLTGSLVNALVATPASSIAEVEKMYHTALNGLEDEKAAAAKILCGASLCCGWNIQEHVVHFVVRLLSPPPPPDFIGPQSHLVGYMPMLKAVLLGASSVDIVHILSLHGLIPEVAASLMPLCEVFGSLVPPSIQRSNISDESSIYVVFSSAFLFLLRLWKFYSAPLEHCIRGRGAMGHELTLEYLLMLRNRQIVSHTSDAPCEMSNGLGALAPTSDHPIYIDSYPKLRAWYCLNKSCVASTLSGLCSGSPIHEIATKILNMIYCKWNMNGTMSADSSTLSTNSINGHPASIGESSCWMPFLSAWEILEAIPLVLEEMLASCAYGRLSSRDLTTGLRDLVDFLPASIASIISYFSAEVTRGIWKPVSMNGVDWPSPAANLAAVESDIKEILVAAGVDLPSCSLETSDAMLPLPMAALVSLTITFKLDKSLEYIVAVAGPALENCASGCPWPSMPIMSSLWAQKIRRWHHFIIFSSSRSIFRHNREAVGQLLRNCFISFLGSLPSAAPSSTTLSSVNRLLGTVICSNNSGTSIAPGFLYLRSCRSIHDVQYVNDIIVRLVSEYTCKLANRWASTCASQLKSSQSSLAFATTKAKEVAALGASLLCVAGGLQRVQELYLETIPTRLLSTRTEKHGQLSEISYMLEGYAMAYLLVLSGSLVWSAGSKPTPWVLSRRGRVFEVHLKFVAGVLEGNIRLGCHPATWKSYVCSLVGLVVRFSPGWIQEVKLETLKKLANGLRGWHEYELAISLLERGGPAAIGSLTELLHLV
ncbi:hypothetical protein Nepgr_011910 [Nepenthes gracilis]|uniref:Mediator of RNA polymerase II transcription subunit 33A n=1 Tax=Nepenthes gracilis TaxID=150966 RepID=A0AAD3SG50_NEPGR|nr:hypothetical protein Nepgr_011910 [Nepenthes gracilis]